MDRRTSSSCLGRLALIVGVPVAALATLPLLPRPVDVVLVNPLDVAVTAAPAGGATIVVAPREAARIELVAGHVSIEARGPDGAALGTVEGEAPARFLERRPTWVATLAPVTSWWVVSKGYGDQRAAAPPPAPYTPAGPLFALDPDLLAVDAPFPEELRVPAGTTGAVRRALWSRAFVERTTAVTLVVDDTGTGAPLRVEVDGAPRGKVAPWSTLTLTGVAPGPHRLRAQEVGPAGEPGHVWEVTGDLDVADPLDRPTYVWNIDGAARYVVLSRRYGPAPAGAPPAPPLRPFSPPGPLFRVPRAFYPGFDATLPDRWRAGVLEALWSEADHRAQGQPRFVLPPLPLVPPRGR
jgi:hypothetical protein